MNRVWSVILLFVWLVLVAFSSPPAFLKLERSPDLEADEPRAIFPHLFHQRMFMCYNCHPGIFAYGRGIYTHDDFDQGRYCGRCHNGKISQNINDMDCETCHR